MGKEEARIQMQKPHSTKKNRANSKKYTYVGHYSTQRITPSINLSVSYNAL
jgi:hypothetical protein